MFDIGVISAMSALQTADMERKLEAERDRAFMMSIKDLPRELQAQVIRQHMEVKEQIRKERIQERRHQEICSAIRASGQTNSLRPVDLLLFAAALT